MKQAQTLTWTEVERLFGAECVVAFDRDIAPQGWNAVLCLRGSDLAPELWADDLACRDDKRTGAHWSLNKCRCVTWNAVRWMTRDEMQALASQRRIRGEIYRWSALDEPVEWRREYLGQWADTESDSDAPNSENATVT